MKFLIVLLGLSCVACTTVLYEGPSRDSSQVATIVSGDHATLARIDGVKVNGGGIARYVVLPGEHFIQLVGRQQEFFSNRVHMSGRMGGCFVAAPGGVYTVHARLNDGYWTGDVYDEEAQTDVAGECAVPLREGLAADSAAVLSHPPHPGTGFLFMIGGEFGGDDVVAATLSNGDHKKLSAGSGGVGAIGGSWTPLWLRDAVGFGAGGRIGVKYDSIDASNGTIRLTRYPLSVWLQSYLRLSERWYFSVAGGAHKELSPGLSGDGVASVVQADFQSPWGWLGEVGVIFAETWHTALGFSVRYTKMRYTIGSSELDASNVGLALTFYANP